MKIQKISNQPQRTNWNSQKTNQQNKNVNSTMPISNADTLMFMGNKMDLVKRVATPVAESLDDALMVGMKKLNITTGTVTARFLPRMEQAANKEKVPMGVYTKTLIDKINATSERIKTLEETIVTQVKPQRVKDAEADISFYYSWDDSVQEAKYKEIATKARKAERDRYWKGFKWMSSGDEKYDEAMRPYYSGSVRYYRVKNDLDNLRSIVADHNNSVSAQRETLEALKREKESYVAQLTSAHLGDYVNQTVNQSGGINQRIAGYVDVKDRIRKDFTTPLINSRENPSVSLPNAVVLYGATGVGKTEMLRGIEQECKNVAEVVHFPMDTPLKKFPDTVKALLEQARNRYIRENKRTILLIDEAEKYMCMSRTKADRLASGFEADDFDVLARYGDDDADNITFLKSLLDRISETPNLNDGQRTKSATTLFITTNYPHLIDQDLMRRKGKFTPIAVHPAKDVNLEEVIKHYFKQSSDLLEQIKLLAPQGNFPEIIRGQVRFSDKAKRVLIEKGNNGSLNNMYINHELSDWPNLERFIKFMNPSDKRGAYSNVEIKDMISRAFDRYLENPTQPMYKYFFEVKDETVRDITPARYSKFKTIYSMVNDKVDSESLGQAEKEFSDLINSYQNGELDETVCKRVEQQMEHIQNELEKLNAIRKNGIPFTEAEQSQYEIFTKWSNMWE